MIQLLEIKFELLNVHESPLVLEQLYKWASALLRVVPPSLAQYPHPRGWPPVAVHSQLTDPELETRSRLGQSHIMSAIFVLGQERM